VKLTGGPYEHPNDLRENYAADFLHAAGMDSSHPDYEMFFRLILRICENTRWRNSQRKSIGNQLQGLTKSDTISTAQLTAIRKIAHELASWNAFPDRNALEAIELAIKERVSRHKSVSNLIVPTDSVTDDQIRERVAKGGTRQEQADDLGIGVRQLARRLRPLGLTRK
jgi:hypothetical protein